MAKLQPRVRTCAVVVFRANELQKPPQLWETATPAVLKMGMKTTTTFPLSKTCSTTRSGRELQAPGAQLPSEPTARNRRITPIACYRVARAGDLGSPQKRRPGRASTTAATASAPVQREVLQLRSGDPTRGSQHSLGRRAFIPDRGALAFARLCSFRERSSSFKAKILPLPIIDFACGLQPIQDRSLRKVGDTIWLPLLPPLCNWLAQLVERHAYQSCLLAVFERPMIKANQLMAGVHDGE